MEAIHLAFALQSKAELTIYLSGPYHDPPRELATQLEALGHKIARKWWEDGKSETTVTQYMAHVNSSDLFVMTDTTLFDKFYKVLNAESMGTYVPCVALVKEDDPRRVPGSPYMTPDELLQVLPRAVR
jgi:hypothetical protein